MVKNFIFNFLFICLSLIIASCNGCKSDKEELVAADSVVIDSVAQFKVENLISTDRQEMFMKVGGDYRWYETCMKLNNFLDEENDGSLEEVVNVFQHLVEYDNGADVKVYKFQHFADGTSAVDSVDGFWVEDQPLEKEIIILSYEEAYERLMEVNIPKPHSKYVTLRKQVGPIDANPQYIFGNIHETLFVDAVTGEVRDYNPAFGPDVENFAGPLGEWP